MLGNSPALGEVDLEHLDLAFTVGVNRILRIYQPNVLVIVDEAVIRHEATRLSTFGGHLLLWEEVLGKKAVGRLDGATCFTFKLARARPSKGAWGWPHDLSSPLIQVGNTPAYALQLSVLLGLAPIGFLGIDFNSEQRLAKKQPTHFYGNGVSEGATGGNRFPGTTQAFFTEARTWAAERGVELYNLTPYDDSPFNQVEWPRMPLEHYVGTFCSFPV